MNDDQFKKLVVNTLDQIETDLSQLDQRVQKMEIRWAKVSGAAALAGALIGFLADKVIGWFS